MKQTFLIKIFLVSTLFFLMPLLIKGVTIPNPLKVSTIEELINVIIDFIFWVGIILAPLAIVVGAFYLLTSGGSPDRVNRGKKIILYAFIGLLIILSGKGIISLMKDILGSTCVNRGEACAADSDCCSNECSSWSGACYDSSLDGSGGANCYSSAECLSSVCEGPASPGSPGSCQGVAGEICNNAVDDDGDTLVDCDDPDCATDPACTAAGEICNNGIDDDGDGLTDCADLDCIGDPDCVGPAVITCDYMGGTLTTLVDCATSNGTTVNTDDASGSTVCCVDVDWTNDCADIGGNCIPWRTQCITGSNGTCNYTNDCRDLMPSIDPDEEVCCCTH
jgi:hypothetical protein